MTAETAFERAWVRPQEGRTLIVGSRVYLAKEDRRKRYADALGVDLSHGEGVDVVCDLERPLPSILGHFHHVECWSVLEHCQRPWLVATHIEQAMLPGATLDVRVPFVWRLHAYPDDYWRLTASAVRLIFPNIEWDAIKYVGEDVRDEDMKVSHIKVGETHFFGRTMVFGFGKKKTNDPVHG